MICIDWTGEEDFLLYGNEDNDNYMRLEFLLVPCNHLHSHLGYEGDSIHPECIPDLAEQQKYLGNIAVVTYYTEELFMQREFDDASVQKFSFFQKQ